MTSGTQVLLATKPRRTLTLSPRPLGEGGQANVFSVDDDPGLVVKLYRHPTAHLERRLESMLLLARAEDFLSEDGTAQPVLTWPSALVEDIDNGAVIGYGMRKVASPEYLPLWTLFNPMQRRQHFPDISWRFLVGLGRNLAGSTSALHERALVLGDVSHANLVVSQRGYLCVLDCDSIQFTDPRSGEHFPCEFLTCEYAPPELQTGDGSPRSPATDDFSLAILACRLLLVGDHPFLGIREGGSEDDAEVARNIADGYSYITRRRDMHVPRGTLDPGLLPPPVLELAERAFGPGHVDPSARPTSEEWLIALDDSLRAIRPCATHRFHAYSEHLPSCPWCVRVEAGLPDVFPSPSAQPPRSTHAAPLAGPKGPGIRMALIALAVMFVLIAIAIAISNHHGGP